MGSAATGPALISPEAGASGVPTKPIFQWSAISGAENYELIVSTEASFGNPSILKIGDYALPTTAWECNIELNYDTTYYWKVRALNAETCSTWSAIGAFTTKELALPGEPLLVQEGSPTGSISSAEGLPSPPPPPTPTTPDWVKYLIGALLAAVIVLSVIVMNLVRAVKRS